MNLLSNAIKFTKEGSVTLTLEEVNNSLLKFEIIDTGAGMSPDIMSKLG